MASDAKKGQVKLKKRQMKQKAKMATRDAMEEAVVEHLEAKRNIYTIAQVQKMMMDQKGVIVPRSVVASTLRSRFNMRFRKIREIAFQGNRERNLALRCMYAQRFLQVLQDGYRLINIDETWLNQLEFNRAKWCQKGETNSLPTKSMTPRISMIAAVSSNGELYCALTQVNTDSDVVMQFMGRLANQLAREDAGYRQKTVILMDNAAYHKSKETRAYFDKLGIKLMLSGPYSYSGAPCELFFAYFKQGYLN